MTVTAPQPFERIHEAIIDELAAVGITCYDHHPVQLYGVPSAYLQASDVMPDYQRADQGELLIGQVAFKLRYYVSLEQDAAVAHRQAYAGVRSIFDAFKRATLGSRVRDARIDATRIDPVEMGANRRPMLLVECDVTIRPAPYV